MTVTRKTGEPVFSDEGNLAIYADPLLTANPAQEIKIFVYKFGGLINMFIFAMQSLLMLANIATAVCPTDVIASNLIATTMRTTFLISGSRLMRHLSTTRLVHGCCCCS